MTLAVLQSHNELVRIHVYIALLYRWHTVIVLLMIGYRLLKTDFIGKIAYISNETKRGILYHFIADKIDRISWFTSDDFEIKF